MVLIFGSSPQTIATGSGWVLEATTGPAIQFRSTDGSFKVFGLTFPDPGCVQPAPMVSRFRISSAPGDTLSGTLCGEGTTLTATVSNFSGSSNPDEQATFQCQRFASNAMFCRRF
jgi:hypothetical protein